MAQPQAPPRKPRTADRHKHQRQVRLPQELWDALDAYRASLPHDPGSSTVVRDVLRDFLTRKGFPPATVTGDD